jgi:hypothetical protein
MRRARRWRWWRRCWILPSVVALGGFLSGIARADAPAAGDETIDRAKVACVQRHEEAQVLRRQGKLLAARSALLACSQAACLDAVRADCVDWLDEVNRSVPSVVISARDRGADVTDVKVFLDGELVATRLTGSALEGDPGEHHLRLVSARGPIVERTVLMSEGVKNRFIEVEFAPPPAPPPAAALVLAAPPQPSWSFADHPLKRSDYLFAGVALASLATATVFGVWALRERSDLAASCGPFCTDAEVSPLRTKAIVADVALGTAAVAVAVGAYRYLTRAPSPRPGSVALTVDATRGTVLLGRTF